MEPTTPTPQPTQAPAAPQPIQPAAAPIQPEMTAQPTGTPPPLNKEANKKSLFLIIGIIILVIILAILSVLLLLRSSASAPISTTQAIPTPTPVITSVPLTPTSIPTDLQQATSVDTGDPTSDLTSVEQDAIGL